MQLPITGPAYKHPSIEVNNQRCVNLFTMSAGPDGRGKNVLLRTCGLELLSDIDQDAMRNMITVKGITYVTVGSSVYKVEFTNYELKEVTVTELGTLSTSLGTVYSAANPTQIIWVDGTDRGFIYTLATGSFDEIVDTDFPTASQVRFLDGYFIVNEVGTGKFYVSSLNDGTAWDALDVATAESDTDNIVGLGIVKGELWLLGTKSTEIWYNAANGTGSPFSPRAGLEMRIGNGAPDSIVELNDLLIWLDNRGFIVQSDVSPFIRSNNSGYDLKIISDEAITSEILSYSTRSDAIAMGYNDRGHLMYQISFPTEEKTWVYDYLTKAWHERAYYEGGSGELKRHLAQFVTTNNAYTLMGGDRDGKLYISSPQVYTDNGVGIRRIRTTPHFLDTSGYEEIVIDSLEIKVGIGNSVVEDAMISLRYSHDGGHTWSSSIPRSLGNTGEYSNRVIWNRLGSGHEWLFEFSFSADADYTIIDATVRTEGASQ